MNRLSGELQLFLPQLLPQQGRVLNPFLTLFNPSQSANILALLGLKNVDLQRLLKQVQKVEQLVDPKLLKMAVGKSGLFLEPHLQQLISTGGLLPPGDLKAEFLRLLNRVNRRLKEHGRVSSDDTGILALEELKQELEGAITRITLNQLAVSHPENPGQQWCFDIPIRFKETMASLSLSICRDSESNGSLPDQQDWKATLSITLPKLGLVEAELFLRGQKISVVIFSKQLKIASLINDQIDQLRTGLESRGLDVSVLISREGELSAKQKSNNTGGSNINSCVDERI